MMDAHDKKILDIIQTRFPLESRPYAAIGEQVGLTENGSDRKSVV